MNAIVDCSLSEGVATLTMNRPQALNALAPELTAALAAALRASEADERTRAIVITGAGRAFSGGGDIEWFGQLLAKGPAAAQAGIASEMEDTAIHSRAPSRAVACRSCRR